MAKWTLYILECGDGSLYTGITNDLSKRMVAHNAGTGAKYTRGRGPLKVIHTEQYQDRSLASKREHSIKSLSRQDKLLLISKSES
ncbi:MAG: GIY-YIG nuclease family protein [Kordiimonas sp.]